MDKHRIDPELRKLNPIAANFFSLNPIRLWLYNFISSFAKPPALDGYSCTREFVPRMKSPDKIRTLVYKPDNISEPLPCLFYIHGGGYAAGSPEISEVYLKPLAAAHPCIIVAPAYRRSTEAPYPAALDDCHDVLMWTLENASSLGIRSDQIIVGGHSAGGGLTAALTLRTRRLGSAKFAFQMPIYPMIDDLMQFPSAQNNTAPVWNSALNKRAWNMYLEDLHKSGVEPSEEAAPMRAINYEGLPPAATFVGDIEPFYDETREYFEKLRQAGVDADIRVYKGCFHGFDGFMPGATVSRDATQFITKAFSDACKTRFAAQDNI